MKALFFASLVFFAGTAFAQESRKSGYIFMSRETQAMQDDEVTGPAALWLLDGEALFKGNCAGCHAQGSMKGVAARYPALHKGRLVNLEQRINACRVEQQKAPAFAYESRELLALASYIGRESRGLPIQAAVEKKTRRYVDKGRETFYRRQGQLNLACTSFG